MATGREEVAAKVVVMEVAAEAVAREVAMEVVGTEEVVAACATRARRVCGVCVTWVRLVSRRLAATHFSGFDIGS